jgi:hypothetical protein
MNGQPIDIDEIEKQSDSKKILVLSLALNQIQTMVGRLWEMMVTGTPKELPIPERIRNIETFVDGIKFWGKFVGTAILLQTLAFASAAIWYAIKLLPVLEKLSKLP